MQLRHACVLAGEAYVARRAWCDASLAACPRHPRGGCGLVRHGTYPRTTPVGMRIARYYCPTAHETFSLLPDCLASHFPGELDPIEHVVAMVEAARSVEAAAETLRPDITLAAAVRWIRRRLTPIRLALVTVVTLWPALGASATRLAAVRAAVASTSALVTLRTRAASHLAVLPTPLGFRARARRRRPHTRWGQTAPAPRRQDRLRRTPCGRGGRPDATP